MRRNPSALAKVTRKVLAATTVTAAAGGMSILATTTASAATVTTDSCTTTVGGQVGDTVTIDGSALSDLVRQGAHKAREIVLVHDLTIWPDHLANEIAEEQVAVGTIPDTASATIGGEAIGAAVADALEGSAGLGALPSTQDKTLATIADTVAGPCEVTVKMSGPPSAGSQERGDDGASGNEESGEPSTDTSGSSDSSGGPTGSISADGDSTEGGFQGTGATRVPRRDYSGIPVAGAPSAGISVPPDLQHPPSDGVPGDPTVPDVGILGPGSDTAGSSTAGGEKQAPEVRKAGNADALATRQDPSRVRLPMLLAVVALAGVTAGLVRTWVLHRVD